MIKKGIGSLSVDSSTCFFSVDRLCLKTEISPIFGMTLMGLIEWVAVAAIASGGAAIVGIIISLFNLNNAKTQIELLKTQIEKQRKVDSARFTVEYIDKILVDNQKTIRVLDSRQKKKEETFESDTVVEALLNGLDNVAQFINDDVIDKKQALNTLRITLRRLKKDDEVKRIIEEKRRTEEKAFDKVTTFWDNEID